MRSLPALRLLLVTLTVAPVLTLPALAAAQVPGQMWVQGSLIDLVGQAIDGSYGMDFRLFTAAVDGVEVWHEPITAVPVVDGLFSVRIGQTVPLTPSIVSGGDGLWLEVSIGGELPLSRRLLGSVASALVAGRAHDLACTGCVGLDEVSFMRPARPGSSSSMTAAPGRVV